MGLVEKTNPGGRAADKGRTKNLCRVKGQGTYGFSSNPLQNFRNISDLGAPWCRLTGWRKGEGNGENRQTLEGVPRKDTGSKLTWSYYVGSREVSC